MEEDSSLNKKPESLANNSTNNQAKKLQKNENDDEKFEYKLDYNSEPRVVPT